MRETSYTPEEITIIGGGLEGCLAAIFAARVTENGHKKYHVTLLEAKDDLLKGASSVAARLHLGAEYPNDPQTGMDCLRGAAIWKIIMPQKGIFTDQPPMRFLIAKKTEIKARRGKAGAAQLHGPNGYLQYYETIKKQYAKLVGSVHQEVTEPTLPPEYLNTIAPLIPKIHGEDARGWNQDQIAKTLFGPIADFSRRLDSRDFTAYSNDYIAGGFQSQEPGLNIPAYLDAVRNAVKEAGVEVITNCAASRVEESKKTGKSYGYKVHCKDGRVFETDQIIQAAWQGGFALDGEHRKAPKTVNVYRRAMALVDISNVYPKPDPSFVLKDESGGMYSPLQGGKKALVYHPLVARLGECALDSADPKKRSIPSEWNTPLTKQQEKDILKKYHDTLVFGYEKPNKVVRGQKPGGVFPFLKNAKFEKLLVQTTLNFDKDNDLDKRRHEPTEEIKPGYHAMYATKLTLSPQSAIEAIEKMRLRSAFPTYAISPPSSQYVLNRALYDEIYRLEGVIKVPDASSQHAHDMATTNSMGVTTRTFGQGFGDYKVSVYADGPKTGPVFNANEEENKKLCGAIRQWAANPEDHRPFTQIAPVNKLVSALSNQLLHADTLELVGWMSDRTFLSEQSRNLLFSHKNMIALPKDAWKSVKESRENIPRLTGFGRIVRNAVPKHLNDSAAVMLPALFNALEAPAREKVAIDIIQSLHKRGRDKAFFAPLGDPDLNNIVIRQALVAPLLAANIGSNGRSIQINYQDAASPTPVPFSITFQGREFYPVQFHFHRTRNLVKNDRGEVATANGKALTQANVTNNKGKKDGKFEFKLYTHSAQEAALAAAPEKDPNNESVGELHAIFMTPKDPATGYRSALALCAHVKIGEENRGLAPYIERLRSLNHPLSEGETIPLQGQPFNPLECFNHGTFNSGDVLLAPFASLNLGGFDLDSDGKIILKKDKSDIFYRGVSVAHLPEAASVTISQSQLEALEKAQPALMDLNPQLAVNPVSRATSGYHR